MTKWQYLICVLLALGSFVLPILVCGGGPEKDWSAGEKLFGMVMRAIMAVSMISIIGYGCRDLAALSKPPEPPKGSDN